MDIRTHRLIAITSAREGTVSGDTLNANLLPFAVAPAHFLIGGARGLDTDILLWLAKCSMSTITVVVPWTVEEQPYSSKLAINQLLDLNRIQVNELRSSSPSPAAYHNRNKYMVDRSSLVIGFPIHGNWESSRGTWSTLDYAKKQKRPRLIVPVDKKEG